MVVDWGDKSGKAWESWGVRPGQLAVRPFGTARWGRLLTLLRAGMNRR